MFFKKRKKEIAQNQNKKELSTQEESNGANSKGEGLAIPSSNKIFIELIKQELNYSADLVIQEYPSIAICYINNLIDHKSLNDNIIYHLQNEENPSPNSVKSRLSVGFIEEISEIDQALLPILTGSVLIHIEGYSHFISAKIESKALRSLTKAENESQVIGSQIAFNENLSTNVALIRGYITTPNLCNEAYTIGKQSNTSLSLLFVKGIASQEMVERLRERLIDLKIDGLIDSTVLSQFIEDNSFSIFPQIALTERPDLICSWLLNGKIAIVVDGSSLVIGCPQSFIEYFQSKEDQNLKWQIATFLRLLRVLSIIVSVFLTSLYVGALTYHYELIPQPLLIPLGESRSRVPYPPLYEALLFEFTIELLREAGTVTDKSWSNDGYCWRDCCWYSCSASRIYQ